MSGSISITIITCNKILGILFPTFADRLALNPWTTYLMLITVWVISFFAGLTNNFRGYRDYYVSFLV